MAFADFLRTSLGAIRRESPDAFAAMCRRLAPREVRLAVDGEELAVRFTPEDVAMLAAPCRPVVEFVTSRAAILDVIDARHSLLSAVLAETLVLRGALDDLLAFHDGLIAYAQGAVRSPSLPRLLERFRASDHSSLAGGGVPWTA